MCLPWQWWPEWWVKNTLFQCLSVTTEEQWKAALWVYIVISVSCNFRAVMLLVHSIWVCVYILLVSPFFNLKTDLRRRSFRIISDWHRKVIYFWFCFLWNANDIRKGYESFCIFIRNNMELIVKTNKKVSSGWKILKCKLKANPLKNKLFLMFTFEIKKDCYQQQHLFNFRNHYWN